MSIKPLSSVGVPRQREARSRWDRIVLMTIWQASRRSDLVRLFGCERSKNAHIERKKSKMTFVVDHKPTRQEEKEIETEMNRLI